MSLRDEWKETGTGLGHAFRDLGKTIGRTAKEGVQRVDEALKDDDKKKEDDVVADATATEVKEEQ